MFPIDFNGLDTNVHGPIRLGNHDGIADGRRVGFHDLKKRLETADGSLNLHLKRLEESGYIASKKAFVGLRPKTTYRITPPGRKALGDYLKAMRQLLDASIRRPRRQLEINPNACV